MSKVIYPTYDEDMSLARSGEIRMPDGSIKQVGRKEAYRFIDIREKDNTYRSSNVDRTKINWKKKVEEPPQPVVEDKKNDTIKPATLPEEPVGVSQRGQGSDSGEPSQLEPESKPEPKPEPEPELNGKADDEPISEPADGFVRGKTSSYGTGRLPKHQRFAKKR